MKYRGLTINNFMRPLRWDIPEGFKPVVIFISLLILLLCCVDFYTSFKRPTQTEVEAWINDNHTMLTEIVEAKICKPDDHGAYLVTREMKLDGTVSRNQVAAKLDELDVDHVAYSCSKADAGLSSIYMPYHGPATTNYVDLAYLVKPPNDPPRGLYDDQSTVKLNIEGWYMFFSTRKSRSTN